MYLVTKKNLEYLDLSNNKLKYFSLSNTPMLEYINLANNMLDTVSLNHVNNTNYLKTFILSNNTIEDIHPYTFEKHVGLEILNLANNNVKLCNNSFSGLLRLTDLSMRNNNIDEIPPGLFDNLNNLRKLDLSKNRIKYFTSNSTFQGLSNLEILNISYNSLQEINYPLLQPLKNLNVLDIAGNRVHYIQYDLIISDLPLLSVLNIKSNYLSCELLYKIIKYLRHKNVNYTINEEFDYEKENVAGIYCNSEKNVSPNSLKSESISGGSYALVVIGGILGVILVLIVIVVSVFKIHVFLKRRKYKADEFELIDE
ncbi:hypothetical protein NQ314_004025 [Rhamnusium bicolor]|uniref:Uncharacterized protein n=1 Tax=Rhamnusium bicolor TaxID=1586634 RepID=A0AAV8ZLN4_9CUCU|nr:hypothetical protein NQ314_004025 [Rhamnusium bicolor]